MTSRTERRFAADHSKTAIGNSSAPAGSDIYAGDRKITLSPFSFSVGERKLMKTLCR
jgi:hypothetical protein